MNRNQFVELSKNDTAAALVWLFDQLEAAELTVTELLGDHVDPIKAD